MIELMATVPAPSSAALQPVRALLADGSVVRLRELTARDATDVGRLHRGLPDQDRYLRFFTTAPVPGDEVLARHVLSDTSAAVGAFRGAELIGVANYVVGTDPQSPEVALAVSHTQQVHGVGTLLLEHLGPESTDAARRARLDMEVALGDSPAIDTIVISVERITGDAPP